VYCWTGPREGYCCGGVGDGYLCPAPGSPYCGGAGEGYLFTDPVCGDDASALIMSGDDTGDFSWRIELDLSFSTYAAGKIPCFPSRFRPVHHSAFVSAMISMISPAWNGRSFGS